MTQPLSVSSRPKRRSKARSAPDSAPEGSSGDAAPEGDRTPEQARSAYDRLKEFGGKKYTGMKVGRGHKWHYAAGDWVEKKVTPDKWEFHYAVGKTRAGHAPEGSGVPVGTEYHWYILADQTVTKLDANNYSTEMVGLKYKLAHKRADKDKWSGSDRAQLERLIEILETTTAELRARLEELGAGTTTRGNAGDAKSVDGAKAKRKTARRKADGASVVAHA